ncbi:MAG: undecaprenyl/decaprenyl-phosphate alpha-N-acetylglucosaminyl 1-phosphate transferase [Caldiserica bacterium]|nr:undecaprenyl/decaprenyl-phosphate alpha-N-acetylglucosaminyl 1-phosphate transferase [Caldisericota bacterium]
MLNLFTVPLIAFFVVILLTPLIGKLAKKWGIVDHPSERKIHREPIPLMGGLAIYLGFLLAVLSTRDYNPALLGILSGGSLIMVTGLIDDKIHLSARLKLVIQVIAVLILIKSGVVIKAFPYRSLNLFFTIFGVIGITNAVNFLDNMDGLASGLISIGCYTYFIISLFTGQRWLGYLSLALGVSCLAFLFYNFKPAKIFMGDAGSTFLGFTLAALSIMGSWAYNVFVAVSVPLLVLFVPVFDTTLITILRIKEGKVKTVRQ